MVSSTEAAGGRCGPSSPARSASISASSGVLVGAVGADPPADDEGLVPGVDLLADPLPDPLRPGRPLGQPDDVRRDRPAAGRQLVEHAGVEVAEHGHGHGARDRRRGHDEHVHADAAGAQGVALLDAEAVLLVDDDEAEVVELDPCR